MASSLQPLLRVAPRRIAPTPVLERQLHARTAPHKSNYIAANSNNSRRLIIPARWGGMAREVLAGISQEEMLGLMVEYQRTLPFVFGVHRPAFETMVYYYPHHDPRPGFPEIGRESRAIALSFGGSGVKTASGRNFMRFATQLRRSGISIISFDYPFHAAGPTDKKYKRPDVFRAMVFRIVKHYRQSGLPLYLCGHSFGPTVIQELLHDAPQIAAGALYFSVGGASSRELFGLYKERLAAGVYDYRYEKPAFVDEGAEAWEKIMDRAARTTDLAKMRTEIPVWLIAGEHDLWNSPELIEALAAKYRRGRAVILKEKDHYIFDAPSERGPNTVVDSIWQMIDEVEDVNLMHANYGGVHPISKILYAFTNAQLFGLWFRRVECHPLSVFLNGERAAADLWSRWKNWIGQTICDFANEYLSRSDIELDDPHRQRALRLASQDPDLLRDEDLQMILSAFRKAYED